MKKQLYINGIGHVSIQDQSYDVFDPAAKAEINAFNHARHPSYKNLIAPAMLRRMSSSVKMGIFSADQALNEANIHSVDAIVVGTGLGCIQDSEKFLEALYQNEEQYLTPTSFIQSTHNTVAAQIALHLKSKAYNFTYVNGISSFESALLDVLLQVESNQATQAIVGGVDEIAPYTYSMFELVERAKRKDSSLDFLTPTTNGAPLSEGATFFALSSEKSTGSYARVVDVAISNRVTDEQQFLTELLTKNNLSIGQLDLVLLGLDADAKHISAWRNTMNLFEATRQGYYQHLSGHYDTASAYGLKLAAEIIKNQGIPAAVSIGESSDKEVKHILLINHHNLQYYSAILISSC